MRTAAWLTGAEATDAGPGGRVRDRLTRRLAEAKRFLDAARGPALLDELLRERPACRPLLGRSLRIDHVGFLAPPGSLDRIGPAAREAGFSLEATVLPSRLVSRELARRAGGVRVQTTLSKQQGLTAAGQLTAVEVFVPDADPSLVEAWIEEGVASHVAVELFDGERFLEIARSFPAAGLPMPAFMEGPRYSADEDTSISFFELGVPDAPHWLEVRVQGDWTQGRTPGAPRVRAGRARVARS